MAIVKQQEFSNVLSDYSTLTQYEDPIWILDKLHRGRGESNSKIKLYFNSTPSNEVTNLKEFALKRLVNNTSVRTIKRNILGLNNFFRFKHGRTVTKELIQEYEAYLNKAELSKTYKELCWESIQIYLGTEFVSPINMFKRTERDRQVDTKYIPKQVIQKLDNVMQLKELPVYMKTMYWILRLIPSRAGEITNLKFDCIEDYKDSYVLKLHSYKQNGGYVKPEIRKIVMFKEGLSLYLYELLQLQLANAQELQEYIDDKSKEGFLFTYIRTTYLHNAYHECKKVSKNICILNEDVIANIFRTIVKRYDIGYNVTSHMLRHNAIADRLSYGFTPLQIKELTAHKGTAMIQKSYSHYTSKYVAKVIKQLNKEPSRFKGRIVTPMMEKRIATRRNVHTIEGLGLCTDHANCKGEELKLNEN